MAVTYAVDTPDVETPEREWGSAAQSDAFDAIVGDVEAYSQEPQAAACPSPEFCAGSKALGRPSSTHDSKPAVAHQAGLGVDKSGPSSLSWPRHYFP